jgi:hypothetical protein
MSCLQQTSNAILKGEGETHKCHRVRDMSRNCHRPLFKWQDFFGIDLPSLSHRKCSIHFNQSRIRPRMTPHRTTPDPDCPICFGRGRYDDDGDRWIECVCMPDLKNLDAGGVVDDGRIRQAECRNSDGVAQIPPCIHSNFRAPQSNLVSLDERKTQETVN